MKFPKITLISLITAWAAFQSDAQQVYEWQHYGSPGTQYLYVPVYGFNQDSMLIQPGADLTWDLSNTDVKTQLSKIITKEAAFDYFTYLTICNFGGTDVFDCVTIWGNTDQAWVNIDTLTLFNFSLYNSQRFQRRTNAYLLENFLGFTADIGGGNQPAVVVYNHPDTILHFPVVYDDQYTSSIQWQIDLNPVGQDVQYYSHQSRTTSIDAWGDVITPLQTFENTVRLRSEILRNDTLIASGLYTPVNVRQVEYMWLDTNYKLPIMVALGVVTDSTEELTSIQYLWDKTCAVPTWTASTSSDTYTIDSTGAVTVEFIIENSNADEYAWDWGDGQLDTTSGSTTHTYTTPGVYEVGLTACMTNCLPLNSCSYDILDFIILTDRALPGQESGIKIYPNPVGEEVNLFIPDVIGSSHFTLLDMNGKDVFQGEISGGLNKLNLRVPNGIYAIQIRPSNSMNNYVMRFIVARQ
ncbi:MAG TPA: PKD domain-containing protein [Saprospiraceae bacterium]|nr:PKD domain-containing protein [Saprospiraceae bacterium]